MRVALVSPYDLGRPGGVQGQVLGIAEALRREGDVVSLFAPGTPRAPEAEAWSSLGASWSVPANGSRAPIALAPRSWSRLHASLRAFRPDVVHVHEPFVPLVGLACLFERRVPLVATFHRAGVDPLYRRAGPLLRQVGRRIDWAVAVSPAAAATVRQVLGGLWEEVEIIANGVDLARFSTQERARRDRPLVVFVGRHEPRKGLEVLLEAICRCELELECVVVGDGLGRTRLEQRYASDARIRFVGECSNLELARTLGSADLFVAPALEGESFGVVLLEAMAAGAAVIASDLPGYRAAAGPAARYVPPGDIEALCLAIDGLARDPTARASLARAGSERVLEFGFESVAKRYRARYLQVVRASL